MSTQFDLDDVDGIGASAARKLASIGIVSVYELAACIPVQLAEDLKSQKESAEKYIECAKKFLEEKDLISREFQSGIEILKSREGILRLSTGSSALDKLLGGGVESKAITEFYGEFGSGKSQVGHTVATLLSQKEGSTIWLDTEGTFRPERIRQIAEERGLNAEKALLSIMGSKIYSSAELEVKVKELGRFIEQFKAKLVIVDSITSLHRNEYLGRGMLADRQQRLKIIMSKLQKYADIYNCAVIITNQVSTAVDQMFGDPTRAVGGNVISHASTYRLYLRKGSGDNRVAKMIDSPYHAKLETQFRVTEKGVEDIEEEPNK